MKKLLIDLIKIPSVSSDIDKLYEIVDFVEKQFDWLNCYIERFSFNNKPSIIISNFKWKWADIVLNWHLDVVPPSEDNQFEPVEKDGKLFARWAWDMKAGDTIIITLMKNLLKNNFKRKKVSLILTTDEEVGGFDWVWELTKLWYGWDLILIPDSWNLDTIIHAEKWIIHLEADFFWVSAHASRPWLWENATDNLFKFYQLLKNYIQNDKKLLVNKSHWWSSVSLNVINGWKATNMLADKVTWKFDIRYTEEFEKNELLSQINLFLKQTNWEIKNKLVWDLLYTDSSDTSLQKYLNICKTITPSAKFNKEHGASDARFFAAKWAKVILHRPSCANLHSKKEYVVLDEIEKIYTCYEKFILS